MNMDSSWEAAAFWTGMVAMALFAVMIWYPNATSFLTPVAAVGLLMLCAFFHDKAKKPAP